MGFLDTVLGRRGPAAPKRSADALFDDEFQRKLEILVMVAKRVFSGAMRAERRSKKTGSGVEFADHRDYTAGDDFRYLDWHAYQRFDRLLIRLYEEEEDLSIYFILDISSSMGFGDGEKLRHAKRLCAALAYVGVLPESFGAANPLWIALLAIIVSAPVSYVVLRRQRDALSQQIVPRIEHAKGLLRANQSMEDDAV